jgi:hypothetical protein
VHYAPSPGEACWAEEKEELRLVGVVADLQGLIDRQGGREHQEGVQNMLANQPVTQVSRVTRHIHKRRGQSRKEDRRLGEYYVG